LKILQIILLVCFLNQFQCRVTSLPAKSVQKGNPIPHDSINYKNPKGKIIFKKLTSADWSVDRSGLIDLNDPISKEKGLLEGKEPIQIYMYVIDHPTYGRYFIDTGISNDFKKDPSEWPLSWLIKKAMNVNELKIKQTLGEWITQNPQKVNGVFLTHLHIDHIMGGNDLANDIPIYTGPKESTSTAFINLVVQGSSNNLLGEGKTIQELEFPFTESGLSTLDFFGDGSLLVMHSPGHTPGSLSFLVHSSDGLQLVLGDTCHTNFGWQNNVPPGDFTEDQDRNINSLNALQIFAKRFKKINVHPGHQSLND
jgi:N-acyl homoserine lactone hydrolase